MGDPTSFSFKVENYEPLGYMCLDRMWQPSFQQSQPSSLKRERPETGGEPQAKRQRTNEDCDTYNYVNQLVKILTHLLIIQSDAVPLLTSEDMANIQKQIDDVTEIIKRVGGSSV